MNFSPLAVEFDLVTPIALHHRPSHLDGLLSWCVVTEAMRRGSTNPYATEHDLPIERAVGSDDWCFKASALHGVRNGSPFPVSYFRPYCLEEVAMAKDVYWAGRRIDVINQATGPLKMFALSETVAWVSKMRAWAVGDLNEVDRLLRSYVTHLGRQSRNGFGEIKKLTVRAALPEETEFWRRRSLPQSLASMALPAHQQAVGGIRAPYWRRTDWRSILEYPASATVRELVA